MPDAPAAGELLNDGQEEVFSRTEVELGRIEHASAAGATHRGDDENELPGPPLSPAAIAPRSTEGARSSLRDPQVAGAQVQVGRARASIEVKVTPVGLLSIGALVSGILLATSALVWTSTSVARRHPLATRLKPR